MTSHHTSPHALHHTKSGQHFRLSTAEAARVSSRDPSAAPPGENETRYDFEQFCDHVMSTSSVKHTTEGLRRRFKALDVDGSGLVDKAEIERYALLEAISRVAAHSATQDKWMWDSDASGLIDKAEFRRAVRQHGFTKEAVKVEDIDAVFDEIDTDGSGRIEEQEILRKLHEYSVGDLQRHSIRQHATGRTGTFGALGTRARLQGGASDVQQQLADMLAANAAKVLDLFRDWDADGDGLISKAEFHTVTAELGLQAKPAEIDALFAVFDFDGSGEIQYQELRQVLQRTRMESRGSSRGSRPSSVLGRSLNSNSDAFSELSAPAYSRTATDYPPPRGPASPSAFIVSADTRGEATTLKSWSYYKRNWSSGRNGGAGSAPLWSDLDHVPLSRRRALVLDRPDLARVAKDRILGRVAKEEAEAVARRQRQMVNRAHALQRLHGAHIKHRERESRIGLRPPSSGFCGYIQSSDVSGRVGRDPRALSSSFPGASLPPVRAATPA